MSAIDLGGDWAGMYHYPDARPPNHFTASLRDTGGQVSGLIEEPDWDSDGQLQAVIDGRHDGAVLTFVKVYDDLGLAPVYYQGDIREGGQEVEGRWSIGAFSGTFLMVRGPGKEEPARQEVVERA